METELEMVMGTRTRLTDRVTHRVGGAWIVAAIALFTGLLAVASSDPAPAPDQPPALWVAHSRDTVKLDAATGRTLLALGSRGEVRTLLVDPVRARLWTYGERLLRAFALDGTPQLTIRLPRDRRPHRRHRDHDREGDERDEEWDDDDDDRDAWEEERHARLALQPTDGALWVAVDQRLHRYDAEGTLLGTLESRKRIRDLAADPANGWVWVGEQRRLIAYDRQGVEQRRIELARRERLQALTWDAAHQQLWLVLQRKIRRVDGDGTLQLEQRVRNAAHPVADGTGGLWFTQGERLVRVDEAGEELLRLRPFGRHAKLVALAFDPADGGVWVAGAKRMRKVAPDGMLGEVITSGDGRRPPRIFALATDSDLLPPTLAITAPEEGALLNDNRPRIELTAEDDGTGVDPDTLTLTANAAPLAIDCEGAPSALSCRPSEALPEGENRLSAIIADRSGNESDPAERRFTVDTVAPTITVDTPVDGLVTNQPEQTLSGGVDEPATLTLDGVALTLDGDNHFNEPLTLTEGINAFGLSATDPAGNIGGRTLSLHLDTQAPPTPDFATLAVGAIEEGLLTLSGPADSIEPHATVTVANGAELATTQADTEGAFTLEIAAHSGDHLSLTVSDAAGNLSDPLSIPLGAPLPPDPATVAPPLEGADFAAGVSFLFEGENPIQTDIDPAVLEPRRTAVIRGRVLRGGDRPLPGVTISIKDHPELGRTLSRADGRFDLAVNGGGVVTLDYQGEGVLPAQRQVNVPWADFGHAPDVVMVPLDPIANKITLSDATTVQVARGSLSTDTAGERRATLLVAPGTSAQMTLPDGTRQPLDQITLRATEYTVGEDGPRRMPGQLPPTSGYTYAVELSIDEAMAAGSEHVEFSQALPVYVENFLGFPVGEAVPAGWYDKERSAWIPSDNGRVIALLSITDGVAEIDGDGDGLGDTPQQLGELGVTEAERRRLAELYPEGATLWRVPVNHFSIWDFNWPYGPPLDAIAPVADEAVSEIKKRLSNDRSTKCPGCVIEAENQTLGEDIPITGTPFELHYRSERMPGFVSGRRVTIPLSDQRIWPGSGRAIKLTVTIAGQVHTHFFEAEPDVEYPFEWDGLDVYGRPVKGLQRAIIDIDYIYNMNYYPASTQLERAFAAVTNDVVRPLVSRTDRTTSIRRRWNIAMQSPAGPESGIAGWSLSPNHHFDAVDEWIERGDGVSRKIGGVSPTIETVVGTGSCGAGNVSVPATQTPLANLAGIAVAPDGSIYLSQEGPHRVLKVGTDGIITVVAGDGNPGYAGDGGPATLARLNRPFGIDIGPDGSLYIADVANHSIRRVDTNGMISTIAGGGSYLRDKLFEVPATEYRLSNAWDVEVASDGTFYTLDRTSNEQRIVRVDPGGIIHPVYAYRIEDTGMSAPTGGTTYSSIQVRNTWVQGIGLAPDNTLYVADHGKKRVDRIQPDGVFAHFAGWVAHGTSYLNEMEGGDARGAYLDYPFTVEVGPDGALYIPDARLNVVRRVDPGGIITTLAGNGEEIPYADGGPAIEAGLSWPRDAAFGADGALYILDSGHCSVRRVTIGTVHRPGNLLRLVAEDGSEYYQFDRNGRHLGTYDNLTGALRLRFDYDSAGRLVTVVDQNGETTTIERDGNGHPTAIIAPHGQRTELAIDANGYLATMTNPAGEARHFAYTDRGLLSATVDPRGNTSHYAYNEEGRLIEDVDPAGGGWTLNRTVTASGRQVEMTSGEGRTSTFEVELLSTGEQRVVRRHADGTASTSSYPPGGRTIVTHADGSITESANGPDPRFGMYVPVPIRETLTTPGGLAHTTLTERSAELRDRNDPFSPTRLGERVSVNGRTTVSDFLVDERRLITTTPGGRSVEDHFDDQGRLVHEDPPGLERYDYRYDPRGRLSRIEQSDGTSLRTTSLTYDGHGNITGIEDALGRLTTLEYDLAGRVVSERSPSGDTTRYSYDAAGNLAALTTPNGDLHQFAYGVTDLESGYTPPDLESGVDPATYYSYDLDKNLVGVARPDGRQLAIEYDEGGRISRVNRSEGTTTYTYNPDSGHLSGLNAPGGEQLRFTYDGPLPLSEEWRGTINGTVSHAYDHNFWVVEQRINGEPIPFQYDNDGLLTAVGELTLNRHPVTGLPAGDTLGRVTTRRSYSGFNEPASEWVEVGGTPLRETHYTRDALGRITVKTEVSDGITRTEHYTYDLAGRLTGVERDGAVTTYRYDANGNRLEREDANGIESGVYDAQDRLLVYGGAEYAYTTNGELWTKTEAGGVSTYYYDVLGNLTAVELADGRRIDYVIDGANRRVGKKIDGVLVQGLLYEDALNPVAELDGEGNVVSRFVYGDKGNVPAYMIQGGVTYRIISDHLGSPREMIDTATGVVVQRMEYDAFGRVTTDTNPGVQPFGFAGGLYDRDTGLVRFGARDYDLLTGRWTSKDPIRFAGKNTNLYGYVLADPVNLIDPTGLVDWGGLALNCASFGFSTAETIGGIGLMAAGGPLFPVGALMAAHGEYGMANSAIGIDNALNETNNPGIAEHVGGSLAGDRGAEIGSLVDMGSSLAGGVRGIGALSSGSGAQALGGAVGTVGAINTINGAQ